MSHRASLLQKNGSLKKKATYFKYNGDEEYIPGDVIPGLEEYGEIENVRVAIDDRGQIVVVAIFNNGFDAVVDVNGHFYKTEI